MNLKKLTLTLMGALTLALSANSYAILYLHTQNNCSNAMSVTFEDQPGDSLWCASESVQTPAGYYPTMPISGGDNGCNFKVCVYASGANKYDCNTAIVTYPKINHVTQGAYLSAHVDSTDNKPCTANNIKLTLYQDVQKSH